VGIPVVDGALLLGGQTEALMMRVFTRPTAMHVVVQQSMRAEETVCHVTIEHYLGALKAQCEKSKLQALPETTQSRFIRTARNIVAAKDLSFERIASM
tara:strand:+ start:265 stop:558 length:294 start_codon:yes stop_codon:yes gene_type:complete